MESLNHDLFLWLNAPEHPGPFLLAMATLFAQYAILAVPAVVGLGWLRGGETTRRVMLEATASGLGGLLINQLIGLVWQHPRPFMIGLGHTFLAHAPDSSFPSDHLTLLWSVAFSLLIQRSPRGAGVALALLGLPVAWARIYLGIHFPFDMVGALAVAMLSAWMAFREAPRYLSPLYDVVMRIHRLFVEMLSDFGVPLR